MRTGEGFLLVYSITSRNSFEEISIFHQQILRVKDQDSFPVIVVANKSDLEYERQVGMNGGCSTVVVISVPDAHRCFRTPPMTEGRDLAKHFGCKFIETSAKQRINVDEAFINLVREIRRYNQVSLTLLRQSRGVTGLSGPSPVHPMLLPVFCPFAHAHPSSIYRHKKLASQAMVADLAAHTPRAPIMRTTTTRAAAADVLSSRYSHRQHRRNQFIPLNIYHLILVSCSSFISPVVALLYPFLNITIPASHSSF